MRSVLRLLSFFLFLTVHFSVFGAKSETQLVSLGATCHMAIGLRGAELRQAAFPFDWLITTNLDMFIRILDEDFYLFTDESYFVHYNGVPWQHNLYYQLDFPHDFKTANKENSDELLNQWNVFKEKYNRRIARFRQLRNYPGKVLFVRAMWGGIWEGQNGEFNENTERARALKSALDRYFPSLDFTLVIVSYEDLPIPRLERTPGIVELRIGRTHEELRSSINKLL